MIWGTRALVLALAASAWCSGAQAASFLTFEVEKAGGIVMLGKIEPGDDAGFREAVLGHLRKGNWISLVYLFLPGGDVRSAIRIGEQVRVLKATTVALTLFDRPAGQRACMSPAFPAAPLYFDTRTGRGDPRCDCSSACVLIWAAGYGQQGNVVGVHRPHFDPSQYAKLSAADAERQYEISMQEVQSYLKRMDFPETLVRVMYATSSKDIYYLSKSELRQFGDLPPHLGELVLARCGVKQALNSSPSEAVRLKNYYCIQAVYEEVSRAGGVEYLKLYGASPQVGRVRE